MPAMIIRSILRQRRAADQNLPGIIQTPNGEQDENDVEIVYALVDGYAANPRTIILAVVQAGNDISNQPIVQKSKKFDKAGERTVGIITKPDLINIGAQGRIALLARNEDTTRLKLGFFIVKNPSPSDLAEGISLEKREDWRLVTFRLRRGKSKISLRIVSGYLHYEHSYRVYWIDIRRESCRRFVMK
ncbi:hypothetical protein LTR02_015414 [Friedmanniomyces endolithicus]|nr:hypothetical protein LTR02_015414 [Friedmanniomyces endolithicus]